MHPVGKPSYEQLLAENNRLRQQLQRRPSSGMEVDFESESVTLRGLKSEEFSLQQLQVKMPGLAAAMPDLLKVHSSPGGDGFSLPELSAFSRFPMKVERLQMEIPEATLSKVLSSKRVEGMSDLQLRVGEGGRITLSGVARKLIPVPFEVEGRLKAEGSALRFQLEKTRVAGFLPVPNLMTNFFASLASREMAAAHVRQVGDEYQVDLKPFLPPNLELAVDRITTRQGVLTLESGAASPTSPNG